MQRLIFSLIMLACCFRAAAQADSTETDTNEFPVILKPDNTAPWRLGVKFGGGVSQLTGSEMRNSSVAYSLNGGMYIRHRFEKKWIVQAELDVAMRGSYFDNKPGEYQLIRLYYVDLPLLALYPVTPTRNVNVVVGAQYSYLINSFIYINMNPPVAEPEGPRLHKSDLSAVAGMMFYTPWVGFQVVGKYSLLNLNNDFLPPSIPPIRPLNSGGDIRNFALELNFIF